MLRRKKFISKISFFSFFIFLIFAEGIVFSSCDNFFENDIAAEESQLEDKSTHKNQAAEVQPVKVSGKLNISGAVPEELLVKSNPQPSENGRAAIPSYTPSETEYFAEAVSETKTVQGIFGTAGSSDEKNFTFLLTPGINWTITCGIRKKNSIAVEDRLLTAELPSVLPENIAVGTTLNFFPLPDTSSGSGFIDLSMTIASTISHVVLTVRGSNRTNWPFNSATVATGGTTATIQTDSANPSMASVPAGNYEVLFSFYDSTGNLLYATVQNITVCKGLTTRAWIASGGESPINSSGVFNVTSAKIETFASTNFYVGDTGAIPPHNDGNSGSHKSPFLTLDYALSVVKNIAEAAGGLAREYTIHICGTVDNTLDYYRVAEIGSDFNDKLAKLTIKGRANPANPPVLQNPNSTGRVLKIATTVPVEIIGLTITGGNADDSSGPDAYGGGLYLSETGTSVTLNNCVIEGNNARVQGGGVYIASGASLIMTGSSSAIKDNEISRNRSPSGSSSAPADSKVCGAGVFVAEGASFQMNAGTISGNSTKDAAGGVYVRGDFTLNDGTITSNKRLYNSHEHFGEGDRTSNIEMGIPGHFIMNGGTITSTLEHGWNGAAVNIYLTANEPTGTATFDMNGGSITGINSRNGAVKLTGYSERNVVFNMTGGSITANMAKNDAGGSEGYGGAICIDSNSTFNMTGGEISGNNAERDGGGIYFRSNPQITIGEPGSTSTVKIRNNTARTSPNERASNICLPSGSQRITVAGALSTESQIGITRAYSTYPFTTGYAATNGSTDPAEIFTSDNDYNVVADMSGEAAFSTASSSGKIYTALDYEFTLSVNRSKIYKGQESVITVTPAVKRNEPGGGQTDLYYNPADQKLYENPAFTIPAGGDNTVSFAASLWCGIDEEEDTVTAGSGANSNKFTIAALTFVDDYNFNVSATYMGVAHDASFAVRCTEYHPNEFDGLATLCASEPNKISKVFIEGREITISPTLWACDHETTQSEYELYCFYGGGSSKEPSDTYGMGTNFPAYFVNWYDAIVYCNLRSMAEGKTPCYKMGSSTDPKTWTGVVAGTGTNAGKYCGPGSNNSDWNGITCDFEANGYRLPTEAEWEYLARGGNLTDDGQTIYSGSDTMTDVAWYSSNSSSTTHEVKGRASNDLGLYDMSGNVCEWCWDRYGSITSSTGAAGPSSGSYRLSRGGSWFGGTSGCSVSNRYYLDPNTRYTYVGFRVVRTAE